MDDENNLEKSDSTEVDEKSDTETECFDKGDSDSLSQSEKCKEMKCTQCKINFQIFDELETHKKHHHPMIVYRCTVDNCPRWFNSRRSRDKHSENIRSRLHKSSAIKQPPSNAIFIENASTEELEIMKNYTNIISRGKGKRGPKPKFLSEDTEKNFLVGLPRDQLKRKLMDSVVEKIESSPNKKSYQGNDSSPSSTSLSKRRPSVGQLSRSSSVTIPNVSSPKTPLYKSPIKANDSEIKTLPMSAVLKNKPIPNLSQLKVPILPLENEKFSLQKFSEDLLTLLTNYDVAEYFKYPLIDHYAPGSSQLIEQIDMETIKEKLKQGYYSKDINNLKSDVLQLYANGIYCFNDKSLGWREAAKLYQTSLVNIQNAEKKISFIESDGKDQKVKVVDGSNDGRNNEVQNETASTHLKILNPYNNGRVSDREKVMSIGEQTGLLKSGTHYLNNYKEDRRNRISILSYLDYGSNFSFGPCYDSGNAYCTKEVSDLLIRGYGDQMSPEEEEEQYRELNEIIPETGLGDDFSLYLMNVLTRDILRSSQGGGTEGNGGSSQGGGTESCGGSSADACVDGETGLGSGKSRIQDMLDNSYEDIKTLKTLNYQRLSSLQVQPTADECVCADIVTGNLTALISEVTPAMVTDRSSVRKLLDLVV